MAIGDNILKAASEGRMRYGPFIHSDIDRERRQHHAAETDKEEAAASDTKEARRTPWRRASQRS